MEDEEHYLVPKSEVLYLVKLAYWHGVDAHGLSTSHGDILRAEESAVTQIERLLEPFYLET